MVLIALRYRFKVSEYISNTVLNSRATVWNGIIVKESAVDKEVVVKKKPTKSVDKPKQTVSITIYTINIVIIVH